MLLHNWPLARRHSLVKKHSPQLQIIVKDGGRMRERTQGKRMFQREKKSKTLIEMGSTLSLENVSLTDCSSPLPQGF